MEPLFVRASPRLVTTGSDAHRGSSAGPLQPRPGSNAIAAAECAVALRMGAACCSRPTIGRCIAARTGFPVGMRVG